jgi:hypothetical protein
MTTDSHALVEIKVGGKWIPMTAPIWPNAGPNRQREGEPLIMEHPTLPRSYALYSLLADVRNRTGRMGVTHMHRTIDDVEVDFDYDMDDGGHQPIAALSFPRGIPQDAWQGWQEFCKQEQIHDPTWLMLDEFQEDHPLWDQVLWQDAVVIEKEYLHWKETGELPKYLARGVGGPGVITVNEAEYQDGKRGEDGTAVTIQYQGKTVREDAGAGWWAIYAMLQLVAPDQDPSNVRLLLAFDS